MKRYPNHDIEAAREQHALERQWREARERRIIRVALDNLDLSIGMLAERFGASKQQIAALLQKHRIPRPQDDFFWNARARALARRRRSA